MSSPGLAADGRARAPNFKREASAKSQVVTALRRQLAEKERSWRNHQMGAEGGPLDSKEASVGDMEMALSTLKSDFSGLGLSETIAAHGEEA